MLTPQDVSNHSFTKAVMGGYNMSLVDEFLDELTDDYTTLYKENAALKAKMKVLVDKVEEYRATEDSMRAALMTAQKMANTIVEDAEKQKKSLLSEAEQEARERIGTLQGDVTVQKTRLEQGQRALAGFIQASRTLCQQQLEFLNGLPNLPVEAETTAAAPAVAEEAMVASIEEALVGSIEEDILSAFGQSFSQEAPPSKDASPFAQEAVEEDEAFLEATRRIQLSDLKFGRNYTSE